MVAGHCAPNHQRPGTVLTRITPNTPDESWCDSVVQVYRHFFWNAFIGDFVVALLLVVAAYMADRNIVKARTQ